MNQPKKWDYYAFSQYYWVNHHGFLMWWGVDEYVRSTKTIAEVEKEVKKMAKEALKSGTKADRVPVKRKSKINDDNMAWVMAMLNSGKKYKDIAAKFGVSIGKISSIAKENGIKRGIKEIPTGDMTEIIKMLTNGVIRKKVAEKFGLSTTRVNNIAKKNGIKSRKQKQE